MSHRVVLAAAAVLFAATVQGQNPIIQLNVDGTASLEALASQNALAGLGDVNGDGIPDFCAGAPSWPMPHPTIPGVTISGVGRAAVFSGATGATLFYVFGTFNLQALGKAVADAGDVDSDGYHDVAIGAPMFGPTAPGATPPPQQVQVWSGAAQSLLYVINGGAGGFSSGNFGAAITSVGDLGEVVGGAASYVADGRPDLLVGAPDGNGAFVYSGADGALMFPIGAASLNLPGQPAVLTGFDRLGESVAGVGDVSGDGVPDLLIGARQNAVGGSLSVPPNTWYAGAALLLSGAGGGLIFQFTGAPGDTLGQSVAGLGDVTGDGIPDFAISAIRSDVGGTDTGSVTAYSGATVTPIWTTHGLAPNDNFGYAISAAGDVNRDGVNDVLVGTPTTDVGATNTGSVAVLSGVDGSRFGALHGALASDLRGRSVAAYGDRDFDGFAEILAGTPSSDVGGASTGSAAIVSFGPFLGSCAAGVLPNGAGGTFDMIRINGSGGGVPRRADVAIGQPFTVSFEQPPTMGAPALYFAWGLMGEVADADAFDPGFGIGTLCFPPPFLAPLDPRLRIVANALVPFEPFAVFQVAPATPFAVPFPVGVGFPVRFATQAVVFDGTGILRTNAIILQVL
jgi:hypothetical protein